jgi:uncharacterized protein YndB with AHSA1/START domain
MSASQINPSTYAADREIILTRLINAPRDLVFTAFTDIRHVDKWWGPSNFRNETKSMDVRPGGDWIYIMRGADGVDFENKVSYIEVKRPERLIYSHGDWQDQGVFHVIITFEEMAEDTKTLLTMRSIFSSAAERKMVIEKYHAIAGGNQTIDRLEAYLPTM